ncbi:hypothetical protein [Planctomicrobium sp. SH527]|uniref:hypothetical protein n=1 Tax=Planctomicrobium sp. SH527 TaxID=3448123 RepID=UPI003F5BD51B
MIGDFQSRTLRDHESHLKAKPFRTTTAIWQQIQPDQRDIAFEGVAFSLSLPPPQEMPRTTEQGFHAHINATPCGLPHQHDTH